MILFLPSGGGNDQNQHFDGECFEGFIMRALWWIFAVIICGVITQEFLPTYGLICFIPIVGMAIHLIIYAETYDKKKKKKNKK